MVTENAPFVNVFARIFMKNRKGVHKKASGACQIGKLRFFYTSVVIYTKLKGCI